MKIVLIGNGASLLNQNLGKIIDTQFDEVVRFNNFQIKGFEKDVGTKTTIWARNTGYDLFTDHNFKLTLVQHTRFPNQYTDFSVLTRPNHQEINPKLHDEICDICSITNLNTSTGIQTLAHFATLGEVTICGFDCFSPPRKYFEPPIDLQMPHSSKESLYIKHLIKANRVEVLSSKMMI